MSRPRLLVTGGSGYLGGEDVRRAAPAGWEAVGTSFRASGGLHLDVRDPQAVAAVVAEVRPDANDIEVLGARRQKANAPGAIAAPDIGAGLAVRQHRRGCLD
mgnify:CR=1 FL=1